MKRIELLKEPLKAAKVIDEYMSCAICKYRDKCNSTPAAEIGEHETMCEKIWLDLFRSGIEDLRSKSTVQMAVFFTNIFRCIHCPVVNCKFNKIGHENDNYCICSEAVYWWLNEEVPTCQENRQVGEAGEPDYVDHPNHYQLMDGVEVIDIIDHILSRADLTPPQDFCLGNVIKYIMRADLKNGVEDYKKAAVYLNRLIDSMERGTENECE